MKLKSKIRPFWMTFCLAILLMFGVLSIIGSGGGGGGGGGGDDNGGNGDNVPPTVPEVVDFSVSEQWFSAPDLLRGEFDELTFQITDLSLLGTYNRTTTAATLSENSGMTYSIKPYGLNPELVVSVLIPEGTTVRWVGMDNPTEGTFQINIVSPFDEFEFDRISFLINNLPGVTITAFAGPDPVAGLETSLTWQEFEDMEDDDMEPLFQQIARLSYSAWQVVFDHVLIAYNSLELTVENDLELETNGSVLIDGTIFPGTGEAGTLQVEWVDESGNQELGPGDTFNYEFNEWWVDDPADDIDDLYNGFLILTGYTETDASVGGDFSFSNFLEEETENNIILLDSFMVNGGFNLTFSW